MSALDEGFVVGRHNAAYEGVYDPAELDWRRVCSKDKARNIAALLGEQAGEVRDVLEVGCGTGAVLLALKRAGIGASWRGIDMADPDHHRDPDIDPQSIRLDAYEGDRLPFDDDSFDLVYASHVLEHVPDERGFLRELQRVSRRFVYVEVPCELNVRATVPTLQRTLDIGHINAYTPEAFKLKLATADMRIVKLRLFDFDMAVYRHSNTPFVASLKSWCRGGLLALSPVLASRVFTYHCGALCAVARGA